jgi:hypothetical protein
VTDDRLKPVRDHLVAACNLLAGASARTEALSDRVRAVERQMDWRGDTHAALHALPTIIADLREVTLTQEPVKVLLPGVADAIDQLDKALNLLKAAV